MMRNNEEDFQEGPDEKIVDPDEFLSTWHR